MYSENNTISGFAGTIRTIEGVLPDIKTHCLLNLVFGKPGNQRDIDKSLVSVEGDKSKMSFRKKIMDCKEFAAIGACQERARQWVLTRGMPAHKTLKKGFYRLPLVLLEEVDRKLTEFAEEHDALILEFLPIYDEQIEKDRMAFGPTFRLGDYPTKGHIKRAFKFLWSYLSIDVPTGLVPSIERREQEKFAMSLQESLGECQDALREGFSALVDRAVEQLVSDKDGNPTRFKGTLVEKMRDFLSYFDARNLANDAQLEKLVDRARAIMSEVPDTRALKDNRQLRDRVREKFAIVQDEVRKNLIIQSERELDLD